MSKLPKEKRDKIILIGMGTAVVCAAIYFLLIGAQRATLQKVREEVAKSREQLESGQRTLKSQPQVKEDYELASKALRQRETGLASPNDMYLWQIQTLNNFRAAYRVDIPQFGREMTAPVGSFPKFPYNAAVFSVRGTAHFHDFGRFLADFENAFPYIRVQNIDLQPATSELGETDTREKLSFKMELLTLVRPNTI